MQKISTIIKGSGMLVAMVIRTVAGDDLWLSEDYSYNKEPIAVIGFVFSNNATAYAPIAHAIEQQLKPFGARPHWGKNFTMPASDFLTPNIYPKLGDFK
jgi:xylitol oxidase